MWLDMQDANRWTAFYCATCFDRKLHEPVARRRKRQAMKAWREYGKGDPAPPLQSDS